MPCPFSKRWPRLAPSCAPGSAGRALVVWDSILIQPVEAVVCKNLQISLPHSMGRWDAKAGHFPVPDLSG